MRKPTRRKTFHIVYSYDIYIIYKYKWCYSVASDGYIYINCNKCIDIYIHSCTYYIYTCTEIQVDGGELDDLERVISTKDSLQNHLSLATHINHTSAVFVAMAVDIPRGYIYHGGRRRQSPVYMYVCMCVSVYVY